MINKKYPINLYEFFLLSFVVISVVGMILLSVRQYSPGTTLLISLCIIFVLILTKVKISPLKIKVDFILVSILILATGFRLSPSLYLEGGQDQGVYVSMSKQYEVNKSLYIKDSLLDKLNSNQKELYKRNDLNKVTALKSSDNSEFDYQFSFYPLHPLWMSLTGFLAGDGNRAQYLTLVSILSILNIYLLARGVTKSRVVGNLSALLLAINPAHIFFSNFPVTEILMLFLTSGGFYYLYKATVVRPNRVSLSLLISVLLFGLSFFTRITSVIMMPVFAFMYLSLMQNRDINRVAFQKFFLGLSALWITSLLFYLTNIPTLLTSFFMSTSILNLVLIICFGFVILGIYLGERTLRGNPKYISIIKSLFIRQDLFTVFILTCLVIYSMILVYLFGFTNVFSGSIYDTFWKIVESGFSAIKDLSLFSLVLYVSPLGVIGYLYFILNKGYLGKPFLVYINVLFLVFLSHSIIILKFIPHHYYFVRYQVSELIPYGIILASFGISQMISSFGLRRILGYLVIALWVVYSLIFSFPQIGKTYGADDTSFKTISNIIDSKTVVFYLQDPSWPNSFLLTPLKYFYNGQIVVIENLRDIEEFGKISSIDKYYLLTSYKVASSSNRISYVYTIKYRTHFMSTQRSIPNFSVKYSYDYRSIPLCPVGLLGNYCEGIIPLQYVKGEKLLFLYRVSDFN
ncbi:hypothetical protein HYV12_03455 [Candidatus Dojkabacteria bacterium]|nr:hypothetical protein [Candidatus Dojkabacteria bacterium]